MPNFVIQNHLHIFYFTECCDKLIISSTGLTKDYQPEVLGHYKQFGYSNGRLVYKNDNGNGYYLHFTTNGKWLVSMEYILFLEKLIFLNTNEDASISNWS